MIKAEDVKNRQQMKEYLAQGIGGKIFKDFGVFSCNFYPFQESFTDKEQEIVDFLKDKDVGDYETITIEKEILEMFSRERISTIFNGITFYFKNHKDLKRFCDIIDIDFDNASLKTEIKELKEQVELEKNYVANTKIASNAIVKSLKTKLQKAKEGLEFYAVEGRMEDGGEKAREKLEIINKG